MRIIAGIIIAWIIAYLALSFINVDFAWPQTLFNWQAEQATLVRVSACIGWSIVALIGAAFGEASS